MNDNERMLRLCLAAVSHLAEFDERSAKQMFEIVTAEKSDFSDADRVDAADFMVKTGVIDKITSAHGDTYRLHYPLWWKGMASKRISPEAIDRDIQPSPEEIINWLHAFRGDRSLTAAAAELGCSTSALQRYEKGERIPSYHRVFVWAKTFESFPLKTKVQQ